MVRLWPWKGDDSSPASFEKTLSTLSTKIAQQTNRLESQRQRSRRYKALWTLYTSILYLIYGTILAVAVGWKNWKLFHYAALVGGPFMQVSSASLLDSQFLTHHPSIYAVRFALTSFYDYRTSSTQASLASLNKLRDATIEKLKIATKYNSTQQLLDKYSGATPKPTPPKSQGQGQPKRKTTPQGTPSQRTGLPPPPTANIPGRMIPPPAVNTNPSTPSRASPLQPPRSLPIPSPSPDTPSFAPNAFDAPSQYSNSSSGGPNWYDRLLDVLLGEDESAPKNRIALLCSTCRLVNGLAPPGVKTLEALGKWRCQGCGAWNGEENEAKRLVAVMKAKREADEREGWRGINRGDESGSESGGEGVDEASKEAERLEEPEEAEEDMVDGDGDAEQDFEKTGEGGEGNEEGPNTRSKAKGKSSKKS